MPPLIPQSTTSPANRSNPLGAFNTDQPRRVIPVRAPVDLTDPGPNSWELLNQALFGVGEAVTAIQRARISEQLVQDQISEQERQKREEAFRASLAEIQAQPEGPTNPVTIVNDLITKRAEATTDRERMMVDSALEVWRNRAHGHEQSQKRLDDQIENARFAMAGEAVSLAFNELADDPVAMDALMSDPESIRETLRSQALEVLEESLGSEVLDEEGLDELTAMEVKLLKARAFAEADRRASRLVEQSRLEQKQETEEAAKINLGNLRQAHRGQHRSTAEALDHGLSIIESEFVASDPLTKISAAHAWAQQTIMDGVANATDPIAARADLQSLIESHPFFVENAALRESLKENVDQALATRVAQEAEREFQQLLATSPADNPYLRFTTPDPKTGRTYFNDWMADRLEDLGLDQAFLLEDPDTLDPFLRDVQSYFVEKALEVRSQAARQRARVDSLQANIIAWSQGHPLTDRDWDEVAENVLPLMVADTGDLMARVPDVAAQLVNYEGGILPLTEETAAEYATLAEATADMVKHGTDRRPSPNDPTTGVPQVLANRMAEWLTSNEWPQYGTALAFAGHLDDANLDDLYRKVSRADGSGRLAAMRLALGLAALNRSNPRQVDVSVLASNPGVWAEALDAASRITEDDLARLRDKDVRAQVLANALGSTDAETEFNRVVSDIFREKMNRRSTRWDPRLGLLSEDQLELVEDDPEYLETFYSTGNPVFDTLQFQSAVYREAFPNLTIDEAVELALVDNAANGMRIYDMGTGPFMWHDPRGHGLYVDPTREIPKEIDALLNRTLSIDERATLADRLGLENAPFRDDTTWYQALHLYYRTLGTQFNGLPPMESVEVVPIFDGELARRTLADPMTGGIPLQIILPDGTSLIPRDRHGDPILTISAKRRLVNLGRPTSIPNPHAEFRKLMQSGAPGRLF